MAVHEGLLLCPAALIANKRAMEPAYIDKNLHLWHTRALRLRLILGRIHLYDSLGTLCAIQANFTSAHHLMYIAKFLQSSGWQWHCSMVHQAGLSLFVWLCSEERIIGTAGMGPCNHLRIMLPYSSGIQRLDVFRLAAFLCIGAAVHAAVQTGASATKLASCRMRLE